MMRSIEKKRSGQKGFTLVELLVVIVILGVLAGIVVFAIGGITDKGKSTSCKADKSALETAEEAYYALPAVAGDPTTSHDIYTDMAGLKSAKLIKELSTLNTIALTGTPVGSDYTVTNVAAKCT